MTDTKKMTRKEAVQVTIMVLIVVGALWGWLSSSGSSDQKKAPATSIATAPAVPAQDKPHQWFPVGARPDGSLLFVRTASLVHGMRALHYRIVAPSGLHAEGLEVADCAQGEVMLVAGTEYSLHGRVIAERNGGELKPPTPNTLGANLLDLLCKE